MIYNRKNIELEEEIERYVNGELTAEQTDDLWTKLIQDEYYLDYLKTIVNLKAVAESAEKAGTPAGWSKYIRYAAVFLMLALGSVTLIMYDAPDTKKPARTAGAEVQPLAPVSGINFGTIRSGAVIGDETAEAEVIRNAVKLASETEIETAVEMLEQQIAATGNNDSKAALLIAAGSLNYNAGYYTQAVAAFDKAGQLEGVNRLSLEESYYFAGQGYLQLGQADKAEAAFREAYRLDGSYSRAAGSYLKAIERERSKQN